MREIFVHEWFDWFDWFCVALEDFIEEENISFWCVYNACLNCYGVSRFNTNIQSMIAISEATRLTENRKSNIEWNAIGIRIVLSFNENKLRFKLHDFVAISFERTMTIIFENLIGVANICRIPFEKRDISPYW